MSIWKEVRRVARLKHAMLCADIELIPASELLKLAAEETGLQVIGRPTGDVLLDGAEAAYDGELAVIYYSRDVDEYLANFYIAHEFGHHWLDEPGAACSAEDLVAHTATEPELSSVGDPDAYSSKERREAQANLFAREFLLPRAKIQRASRGGATKADAIARYAEVPVDLVMHQMVDALLLPQERRRELSPQTEIVPDKSQTEAVEAPHGPRQVLAGPGTGKTRTLVGRVKHLINRSVDPSNILALTYSNLSAQDLAGRLRDQIGEQAISVWSGTFHAFGLEIIRKYGHELGIEGNPKPLDRTDSLMLLVELLPSLELDHYLDLHEPLRKLRSILGAIGRAKDDLKTPEEYTACVDRMRASAFDAKSVENADRAAEVAQVYDLYESTLRERGLVDFGDLLALPVRLMRQKKELRDNIREERKWVLVDEYQDMNRASGLFLKEICTPEFGPWVVGDARQSIYGFRGASPLNMVRFGHDFPGAQQTSLTVNYRSYSEIVGMFESFGRTMASGNGTADTKLHSHRGSNDSTVRYDVADTRESEAAGIIDAIQSSVDQGSDYSDHVVIARSHKILTRIADQFDAAGIPCLYFGNFFTRPEVRDLLCVLSLCGERRGNGVYRIAQSPAYEVPAQDVAILIDWRRESQVSMLDAVRHVERIPELSTKGLDGLLRLKADLDDVSWKTPPHQVLMQYLLSRSDYLKPLLAEDSVSAQQRRLAIFQLLQFAFAFQSPGRTNPCAEFLAHIRRLEVLDEEKQLRQLPAAASDISAVRLMTVHAAKGLEFPHVHVASVATQLFPAKRQAIACPMPEGLLDNDAMPSHDSGEDSLFFVAISRARDSLHVSRTQTNGKQKCSVSRFLPPIENHLPHVVGVEPTWRSGSLRAESSQILAGQIDDSTWTATDIETYEECPRRLYYQRIVRLDQGDNVSAFLKLHRALKSSWSWLLDVPASKRNQADIATQFDADWQAFGPTDDPLEAVFRTKALEMLQTAIGSLTGETLSRERAIELPITKAIVTVSADCVQREVDGIVIRRLKAGKLAKKERDKIRYPLMHHAVRRDFPTEHVSFEHVSLMTGDPKKVDVSDASDAIERCERAVASAKNGSFDATPNQYCATCPFFFLCPAHGDRRE